MKNDTIYELKIDVEINGLSFRDRSTLFFFDVRELYDNLIELREKLSHNDICSFDLMYWPKAIFAETPLRYNPGSAHWVYYVIETWVTEMEDTIHKEKNKRIFDGFLATCKEYTRQSERVELKIIKQWIETDNSYKKLFEHDFILLLVTFGIQLTNDPVLITNFINGLAILPEYFNTNNKDDRIEFDKLTRPVLELILKDIKKAEEFETYLNKDLIPIDGFYRLGFHFPISRSELSFQIDCIYKTLKTSDSNNKIVQDWNHLKNDLSKHKSDKRAKVRDTGNLRNKPKFQTEYVTIIFDIIKDFFDEKQHQSLKTLLESGGQVDEFLIFLDEAIRLADAFKRLYNADIITQCSKKHLASWISGNFMYQTSDKPKPLTLKNLENTISSTEKYASNPINGIVQLVINK